MILRPIQAAISVISIVALATIWLTARPADSAEAERPNFVVILADDLGYGDLHCYGAADMVTPNLDRLVAAGMRMDNFYANCPVCSPTRAALMTGRYQELVGVPGVIRTHADNSWGYLDPAAMLLPQLLKQKGYHTALVGKWHLGLESPQTPNDRGFDLFHGFLGDMMDDYWNHRRHGINYMRRNRQTIDPSGHATDLFSEWACEYLGTRSREEAPFFLYLAYNAPHSPIQPPPEWLAKTRQRLGRDDKRTKLIALIEHMDAGVGRVLQTLKETGLADSTLIVFTSDNGGQLSVGANNGPYRDGKGSVYEGGLRVPCCAVWPGHITPGSRCDRVALTMDLFPTLCAAAAVEIPHPIDGRSFLPTLLGKRQPDEPRDIFFIRREGGLAFGGMTIQAVRRGDWKLLQNSPFAPQELYNLADDPRETHNVSQSQRRVFRQLAAALRFQVQRGGAVPWQPPKRRDAPVPAE